MSENKPTPESTCPAALPFMITDQEMKDLMRFHECVTDGEGYDVPKERMKQLAEIGLLRRVTSDFYEHTTFGLSVINGDFQSADEIRKQRDELLADRDTWKARAEFSYQQRDVLEGRASLAEAQRDELLATLQWISINVCNLEFRRSEISAKASQSIKNVKGGAA